MIRTITKIEDLDKKRSKVYLDEEFAFVLYKGELSQYHIFLGNTIEEKVYQQILNEILSKRAKKRCLNLLQKKTYTEYQLRKKLKEGFYPDELIEEAVEYVKSYHYIDDYRYACEFIFYHKDTESRKKIEEKLRKKGISQEVLQRAQDDSYDDGEEENVELNLAIKLLEKKHYNQEIMETKEKQKLFAFLSRKGISISIIKKAMSLQDIV